MIESPVAGSQGTESPIIGESPKIRKVRELIRKVAATSPPVLVLGETGTGKELVAQEIHRLSRANCPFVAINCAAIPEGILESELFGHEKGAFTGATTQKMGLIETAQGGTLFLDEIGEMPLALQAKLLRFLQEHKIQRVGGTHMIPIDVRVIAASNRNLTEEVKGQRFREDLFYRLNVLEITLPPLRERFEDLPLLIEHFVDKYKRILQWNGHLSPSAVEILKGYAWPGNVRELENVIEGTVILMKDAAKISFADLPSRLLDATNGERVNPIQILEKEILERALLASQGNQTQAARQLGLKRSTLQYRLHKYNLAK